MDLSQLQDVIDAAAAELKLPISVEDGRFRLLAHSAHDASADAVRECSIMRRETAPDVARWLDSLNLRDATGVIRVPAAAELGMRARLCVPLRHRTMLLGYLWVIEDAPLSTRTKRTLRSAATVARDALRDAVHARNERRARHAELVTELCSGSLASSAPLPPELNGGEHTRLVVALGRGDLDTGERARRRWSGRPLVVGTWNDLVAVIGVITQPGDARRLAQRLVDDGAERAAAGGIVSTAAQLPKSAHQAIQTLVVLGACTDDRAGTYDALDVGWQLIVGLWLAAGKPGPPAAIERLLAHRAHAALLPTLCAVVETDADITHAAESMNVHRATVYRRVERIEALTGLDLSTADGRLVAQIGLRFHALKRSDAATAVPPVTVDATDVASTAVVARRRATSPRRTAAPHWSQ